MAKQAKTLDSPRRSTRSSISLPPSTPAKPSPPAKTPDPLLPSAAAGDGAFSLADLLASLPGRNPQVLDLLRLVGRGRSPVLPLLLHGGAATGKTRTLLLALRHLGLPFAYASCRSCPSPRALFDSLLAQLLPLASRRRCDKAPEFVSSLRESLLKRIADSGHRNQSGSGGNCGNGEMVYLVFDNLELIRSWEKGSSVLSLLLRLHDLLRIPQVGLIYVSSATPDAYYSMTGSIEPNYVYFPDYTVDELHDIFMMHRPNPKLYSSFLSVVLKPFFRVSRRVDELATAFEPLFRKYCEPLADSMVVPDEGMKRRLFDHIQPHLAAALNETFSVPARVSSDGYEDGISSKKGNFRRQGGGKDGFLDELDFHMSVSAKYLLLSAFLASRNPATLDAALFDSTGGSDSCKRKRKSSQTSMNLKDSVAEEMLMKGPGTFPLERLLAIFQCITSVSEDILDEVEPQDENGRIGLMSDVLLQLSTLCSSNFLSKSGSCPLEGSARYRSNVDEDLALKVARSVNFPLSKYLYRR